jgi:S-adenosylmethionine decarboxylase
LIAIPHLLIDALECDGPLDDAAAIQAAMQAAAEAVGATVVGQAECRYVPHGVTAVLFLAESHILVSTWPEHKTALVDVLLCNEDMDPQIAADVLLNALGANRSVSQPRRRTVLDG